MARTFYIFLGLASSFVFFYFFSFCHIFWDMCLPRPLVFFLGSPFTFYAFDLDVVVIYHGHLSRGIPFVSFVYSFIFSINIM